MIFAFNPLMIVILPALLSMSSLATPVSKGATGSATHSIEDISPRDTNTCADPSLSRTVLEWFGGSTIIHDLEFRWIEVNVNSQQAPGPAAWTLQGPVFKAWPTQQPFTVPLFRLLNAAETDFIFMTGPDAQTPPVVSGFKPTAVHAWVYNTSVCDSVPLLSAVLASQSDHFYTTDPVEHDALISEGWTDGGVAAFVLPLPSF